MSKFRHILHSLEPKRNANIRAGSVPTLANSKMLCETKPHTTTKGIICQTTPGVEFPGVEFGKPKKGDCELTLYL